jgi:hypothetical protein
MSVTISGDGTITGVLVDKRIEAFTASGTFTVPAGVTYAIAHMLGGGGGIGQTTGGAWRCFVVCRVRRWHRHIANGGNKLPFREMT